MTRKVRVFRRRSVNKETHWEALEIGEEIDIPAAMPDIEVRQLRLFVNDQLDEELDALLPLK